MRDDMKRTLEKHQLVERSIIREFRKTLWNPFIESIKRYQLIAENDHIAVCISGGKDSVVLAKLMQQLQKHSDVPFELTFLVMDPGYSGENRKKIEENAALLHIPITLFETDIFAAADDAGKNPCYLCARMRRGHLYKQAKRLGCNKIALGHHFDDVIETTLMGMFYGSQLQAMPPKVHSAHFPGMELIRPLYCVREEDIIAWAEHNDLSFIRCACRMTEKTGEDAGKRQEIKRLLKELRKDSPSIEKSIFSSIHRVCLDTMVGCRWQGEDHDFPMLYAAQRDSGYDAEGYEEI